MKINEEKFIDKITDLMMFTAFIMAVPVLASANMVSKVIDAWIESTEELMNEYKAHKSFKEHELPEP